MIPVCLVSGFLGSGKTTLLRRLIERYADRPIAWLINEFSAADVDSRLIEAEGRQVLSVAGGSIFCRCKAGQFIHHMNEVAGRVQAGQRLDGMVIEASGIANPTVIARMLAETQLDQSFSLAAVVCVVDPGSFTKLLSTLPNMRDQVAAADMVLINKCDLFDDLTVDDTEQQVRAINAGVPILRCEYADAQIDPLSLESDRQREGEYAQCVDPNFATVTVDFARPIRAEALDERLKSMADVLYRAKGFVESERGWLFVDYSASGLTMQPAGQPGRSQAGQLVLITRGDSIDQARALRDRVEAGELGAV
jgi:G3E family GTPase